MTASDGSMLISLILFRLDLKDRAGMTISRVFCGFAGDL